MNKKSLFPKGFFQNNNFKEVSTKAALKGVIPLKWEPNGKKALFMLPEEKAKYDKL